MSALKPRHVLPAVIALALVAAVINQGTTASGAFQRPKATAGNKTKTSTPAGSTSTTSTTVPSITTATTVYTPPQSIISSTSVPSITTAGTVYTPPSSIAADCSTDVAPVLNGWIATVPDGTATNVSVLSFPPNACYEIEESLYLPRRNWLDFEGSGTSFKSFTNGRTGPTLLNGQIAPDTDRAAFYADEGTHLTWHNLNIVGSNNCTASPYYNCYNTAYESQAGFRFSGVTSFTIDSVNVNHVWGDFAEVDADATNGVGFNRYVTIKNSSGDHFGRHALTCEGCQDSTFTGNSWSTIAYDGVDMEIECQTYCTSGPDASGRYVGGGEVNVTLANNSFADVGEVWVSISGPGLVNNVTYSGNQIHGGDGLNFFVSPFSSSSISTRYSNLYLLNNSADSLFWSSRGNVELVNVDGATISGNTMPHDNQQGGACGGHCAYSVDIWGSTSIAVQHNTSFYDPYFLQVDGPNAAGGAWTGNTSSGVTNCGNTWGGSGYPNPPTGTTSDGACS